MRGSERTSQFSISESATTTKQICMPLLQKKSTKKISTTPRAGVVTKAHRICNSPISISICAKAHPLSQSKSFCMVLNVIYTSPNLPRSPITLPIHAHPSFNPLLEFQMLNTRHQLIHPRPRNSIQHPPRNSSTTLILCLRLLQLPPHLNLA
jgi:hypothetical protein